MAIPLENELLKSFRELEIPGNHLDLTNMIYTNPGCADVRKKLLDEEKSNPGGILSGSTFWDVSTKYRWDVLAFDISAIANRLALSLALANIYLPSTAKIEDVPYIRTRADELFWYAVDTGFRLTSSGWDRIGLLLDVAFALHLGNQCSFKNAIRKITNVCGDDCNNPYLKALLEFRDTGFVELEGHQRGEGIRHETTHLMLLSTRFTMECLENVGTIQRVEDPHEWFGKLRSHYDYYVRGIADAVNLIGSRL